VHHQGKDIALAHNGRLVNAEELRRTLEEDGAIFRTVSDCEIFMHLIVRAMRNTKLEDAVVEACSRVRGSYCLVLLVDDTLIGLRDPFGVHPLVLGQLGDAHALVSETCALDLLEAEYLRAVEPGEMVVIRNGHVQSRRLAPVRTPKQCIFELVYFGRPDSLIFGEQVYLCRKRMGGQIARESAPDVDFVMPFPDSGVYAAVGFAQGAALPYEHAMIRNHYVGRTFIQPTQGMRNFSVRVKINPVRAMIEGKRICIVDDSIVRGTTMLTRVKKLRELGALEVHIRISCPPVRFPCRYGIDFASRGELIAACNTVEEIRRILDADSLHYLSLEGLARSVTHPDQHCLACLTGEYPVPPEAGCRTQERGVR
jgi:amidophosphoribosyltransferase